MFQYFSDEDVAVASIAEKVFFLSRSEHPYLGAFQAVNPRGEDITQDAVDIGLRSTFLGAAESAQVKCLLQTMDGDICYDQDLSDRLITSMSKRTRGGADKEDLVDFEEVGALEYRKGLSEPVETPFDDLYEEESVLRTVGPMEPKDQTPVVLISPSIPDEEMRAFSDLVVRYRLSVGEDDVAAEETYAMLFLQPEVTAWVRTLRSLHHLPYDDAQVRSIQRIEIRADTVLDDVLLDQRALLVGWQDLYDGAIQCLGPAGYASHQEYDAVSRSIDAEVTYHADLAERAIGQAGKKLY